MPYRPRPGTMPHRAVEILAAQRADAELSTFDLGTLLGLKTWERSNLATWLAPARQQGLVRTKKVGRMLFWSLGEAMETPKAPRRRPQRARTEALPGPVPSVFALATCGEWQGPWPPLEQGQRHTPLGSWNAP